jgi:hypothetical protein
MVDTSNPKPTEIANFNNFFYNANLILLQTDENNI